MLPSYQILLALILALAPSARVEDGTAGDAARRVQSVLAEWQRTEDRRPQALTRALVAIGRPAEPVLIELLERPSGPRVIPVAAALGEIGSARCLPALTELATSPRPEWRSAGIRALGALGLPAALPVLIPALDDDLRDVRDDAASSIFSLAQSTPELNVVGSLRLRLREIGRKDQLCLLLGRLGTSEARALLRELVVQWFDEKTVLAALGGLWIGGQAEDGRDVHAVLESSVSKSVRRKACLVLGRLRYSPSTRLLIDCLADQERGVRADAHWALEQITGLRLKRDLEQWETWWELVGRKASDDDYRS